MGKLAWQAWALTGLLLLVSACSPWIQKPGKPVAMAQLAHSHFVATDGAVLPLRHWPAAGGPPKANLVALHGFNDYSRFFESTGDYLGKHGINCFAYDQRGFGNAPGHGLWAGTDAYVADLRDFVAAVRARHPGIPTYVLGESMGGAITIVATTGEAALAVDGVILSAPAVWGRRSMPWYQRGLLALTAHTLPWLRLTGEGLKIKPSDNIEMLRALGRDPLVIKATRVDALHGLTDLMDVAQARAEQLKVPSLFLYGEQDEIIPKEPVFKLLANLTERPAFRAAYYPDGYHMLLRDLGAERAWSDIVAWIADRSAPLPSGADRRLPALAKNER